MIVGTKDVQASDVRAHCTSVEALKDYCKVLVPRVIRHDARIVANQQYYVAMIVRDIKSIPYLERKRLYEGLLVGVSISGIGNTLYDFEDLIAETDINLLAKYISQKEKDDV